MNGVLAEILVGAMGTLGAVAAVLFAAGKLAGTVLTRLDDVERRLGRIETMVRANGSSTPHYS